MVKCTSTCRVLSNIEVRCDLDAGHAGKHIHTRTSFMAPGPPIMWTAAVASISK